MTQYLVLVKGGIGLNLNNCAAAQRKLYMQRWRDWLKALRKEGCLVTGSALVPEGEVVYSNGKTASVPDNYDMISETITGFCVIKADTPEEANGLLSTCPFLEDQHTCCELREYKTV